MTTNIVIRLEVDERPDTHDRGVNLAPYLRVTHPAFMSDVWTIIYFSKVEAEITGKATDNEELSAVYYFRKQLFKLN